MAVSTTTSRARQPSTASLRTGPRARRPASVSQAVLTGILVVQTGLTLRLQNTAFDDEALYLYAGHLQLDAMANGNPLRTEFTGYFSGSPLLYPPLAATVDSAFGLSGARALSLIFMLGATILVYALSRLLFDDMAGVGAAALFSTTQSTLFLGHLATYDAAAVLLLALAAWLAVRGSRCSSSRVGDVLVLGAAAAVALGVAVKYATLMFLPTVAGLALLTAYDPGRWSAALRRALLLCGFTGALLAGALALGGASYLRGLTVTTTAREHGDANSIDLLVNCLQWGGGIAALALLGTAWFVSRRGDSRPRWWRLALGGLLCGTALLAPAYQMYLHMGVSLHKHIGFGLLFAAPMAGIGLSTLVGRHFRLPQLAIACWVTLLTFGITQSQHLYRGWADSSQLVAAIRPQLQPDRRYLVEADSVPQYYLRAETTPEQWTSTYSIDYTDRNGNRLTGQRGYQAALRDGHFDVVVLSFTVTEELDRVLAGQLRTDGQYRMLGKLPFATSYGKGSHEIWVRIPTT
jgi:Dolichyl-phosphate-mannose-protein mannosyltransferase